MTDSDGILAGPTERKRPGGWLGKGMWVGSYYRLPLHRWTMARKRMFKELALVTVDNVGHTGGATHVATIEKQSDQFTSAYVDKIRIAYHLDFTDTFGSDVPSNLIGTTFYLTNSASSPNSSTTISATGSDGAGGTITLDAKRSIKDNTIDSTSGQNAICIWVQTSNVEMAAGDVSANLAIEAFGRWHAVIAV